jgi:sulfite reductase (NADPH) flavoprotein alpha-component
MSTGVLTKINLAWSRDNEKKHYVQHEIKKESLEFIQWIDSGAYLFICGNKEPMSMDVEETIINVLCEAKNISREEAIQLLEELNSQGRYVKDVY